MKTEKQPPSDWEDEGDEPVKPGPKPERLKSDETLEQVARRILDAGKPAPEDLEDEDGEDT